MATYGSIAYLFNEVNVTFDTTIMNYGKATSSGGALYADGTGTAQIIFSNCK